jgi:TM2 domain-containing membrane protein YozV
MIKGIIKTPSERKDDEYDTETEKQRESEEGTPAYRNKPEKRKLNGRWLTTLLLGIFTGWLGVHRFYNGKIITGILMLLTCGGLFIWQLIDVVLICAGQFKDKDGGKITMRNDSIISGKEVEY